jgi:hypothetical protein
MMSRKIRTCLAAASAAAVLAGCGSSETASFIIDGPETALTLERIHPYAWSSAWQLQLVVRRFPDCQRRHDLLPTSANTFKIELFMPTPGVFIMRQGKRWYVTDLKTCDLQAFKEPPPEPGMQVGTFVEKDGELRFVKTSPGAAPLAPSNPAAPGLPAPQQASSE